MIRHNPQDRREGQVDADCSRCSQIVAGRDRRGPSGAHTPTPWRWTWQEERTCYALKGAGGVSVLEITKGLTPTIHDQSLMAAAPRMLALLRQAHTLISDTCPGGVDHPLARSIYTAIQEAAS